MADHWIYPLTKKITSKIKSNYWVDDMKTPSGRVHVGALRGVLVHDFVYQELKKKHPQAKCTYVFNDMDPMDGLPGYLDKEKYLPHMGKPLYQIPAPKGKKNFAQYYADEFIQAFNSLQASPAVIWSHQLYESGQMDSVIEEALDKADQIRRLYKTISGYQLHKNWLPFQVICPKCGKVGTTTVTDWDGQTVAFICELKKVAWAKGCGYSGRISPFGGTGKLLWKVDWPAHWKIIGVNIEGAGKDHSSAGGSRDLGAAICEQVFDYHNPFDIPYEWFLIKGAKMSSSKGTGASAAEFTALLPGSVGRFLFARTRYNRAIDFDLYGATVLDLFDEYDRAAQEFWQLGEEAPLGKAFSMAHLDNPPKKQFLPRFRDVVTYLQSPSIDLIEQFAEKKGSQLTKAELAILKFRVKHAQLWLDKYAPEEFKFEFQKNLPESAKKLSSEQIKYLNQIPVLIKKFTNSDDLQTQLYQQAKDQKLSPKLAFQAIYQAFIGKNYGPKAAWLLKSFTPKQISLRLKQL